MVIWPSVSAPGDFFARNCLVKRQNEWYTELKEIPYKKTGKNMERRRKMGQLEKKIEVIEKYIGSVASRGIHIRMKKFQREKQSMPVVNMQKELHGRIL